MIIIRKLVNIVNIVCEVRGIMIKNRAEKGACEQDKKNKGKTEVMELVVHIMANPFSTQGALLSHSSPSPPYGGPG